MRILARTILPEGTILPGTILPEGRAIWGVQRAGMEIAPRAKARKPPIAHLPRPARHARNEPKTVGTTCSPAFRLAGRFSVCALGCALCVTCAGVEQCYQPPAMFPWPTPRSFWRRLKFDRLAGRIRRRARWLIAAAGLLGATPGGCGGASPSSAIEVRTGRQLGATPLAHRLDELRRRFEHLRATERAPQPNTTVPYRCEDFHVEVDRRGRRRVRRHRKRWTRRDQVRFRRLLAMVARTMGADPRLFQIWALRESSYRPHAIHVLDPDLTASRRAWERMRYSPAREATLRRAMEEAGRGTRAYYEARAELRRILTFRDNPTYDATFEVPVHFADGARASERILRWHYGYGPFGFNPVYFLPVWDAAAPPWIFCDTDGLAAAVTAVWAARRAAAECRALGYAPTYEVVNRRFSGGRCTPRPAKDAAFRRRARARGLDPDKTAQLGRKFPRDTTDRVELLRLLYQRARDEGLLSSYALEQAPWFMQDEATAANTPPSASNMTPSPVAAAANDGAYRQAAAL
ncbi:MAG: hypothetical protein D6705_05485 [Deltaproteobacteria bacterium]|nr:MAG: hypothetical protein D6705_05485 [Deltaproteobacteria bacterium]